MVRTTTNQFVNVSKLFCNHNFENHSENKNFFDENTATSAQRELFQMDQKFEGYLD